MEVVIENSTLLKPAYDGPPPPTTDVIPLNVFDKVNFDMHIIVIYVYRNRQPPNHILKEALQKVLSKYRVFAGRLGWDRRGDPVIFLNDEGMRLVEARIDACLDEGIMSMLTKPSRALSSLHPGVEGAKALKQVQLTRFKCGSLVVGNTTQHLAADGYSAGKFSAAWGKACRSLDIGPLPTLDRSIFLPRSPPKVEFEHYGVEFTGKKVARKDEDHSSNQEAVLEKLVVHHARFERSFLETLKSRAAGSDRKRPYTTFESLTAHLWRCLTRARGLDSEQTTQVRIAVDGRRHLKPVVTDEYFGNVVLWAFPKTKVKDLLAQPLSYAAKLIHIAVERVDTSYFKSFIDFATYKMEEEDLIPTADADKHVLTPDLEVDSWLGFRYNNLDFGRGGPSIVMPAVIEIEGQIVLMPSAKRDGRIDAFVTLFQDNLAMFERSCYTIDYTNEALRNKL